MTRCRRLHEILGAHHVSKLLLTEEEALHQRAPVHLEVGEHAQLLHRARGEVLGLVDEQQRAFAEMGALFEIRLQVLEDDGLGLRVVVQPELGRRDPQEVLGLDLGRHDVGDGHVLAFQHGRERAHQHRLPGTDVPGDHDETFALLDPVEEVGHRSLVAVAVEEHPRVGVQAEGLAGQVLERLVHGDM